jgi:hypothetical protein
MCTSWKIPMFDCAGRLGRASERPDGPSIDVQAGSPLVARVDPKRFRQIVRAT